MRILLVNHTFPPASFAGSEICVLNLAKEWRRRGHEAAVFYRIHDPSREEYSLETGEFEGVPVFILNHTYRFVQTFQEIYVNSVIAARFAWALGQWKPDIVHFHHLTNLSLSLVDEVKARKIPAVMTLHDYWLLCQRGQMLKRDLSLCKGPSLENCRACLAPQLVRGKTQRFISALMRRSQSRRSQNRNVIDLSDFHKANVTTPDRRFVAQTCFEMGDGAGETLQAHPPSSIAYSIQSERPAILETSIAMHPSTYNQEGEGVEFQILQGDKILFSRILNPKRNEDDRGWHEIRLELPPSGAENEFITLKTIAESDLDNRFCTAGWRKPAIRLSQNSNDSLPRDSERKHQIRRLAYQAVECIAAAVAAFSAQANEGIHHRMNWARRVLEQVDLFVSPSRFLRDFFIQQGTPEDKIIFLDNGFEPIAPRKPKPVGKPIRFGYIGTWIPSKGVDLALRAFQTIDPQKARLIVHGFFPGYDGYEDYELQLRTLAGPAVEWGRKYQTHEIYDLLSDIDCMITPSIWWENSPLTMHEAFLAQVPIITANVGGMAEQVALGGGLTFQHRDPDSLRGAIQRIIDSPKILDDLRRSIPCVQSMTGHATRLKEIYTSLLNENSIKR